MIRVSALPFGLQPTLYRGFSTRQMFALRARIWHIKEVPLGTPVGYGPLAYTRRRTRIAVIPYGFGDGIHRIIGNRCKMLVPAPAGAADRQAVHGLLQLTSPTFPRRRWGYGDHHRPGRGGKHLGLRDGRPLPRQPV